MKRILNLLSLSALAFWLAFSSAVLAQEIDYTEFSALADRAERILDTDRASDDTLEQLRSDLAGWREKLLGAQDINAERIATLQNQIDAIGPPPESGDEPAEIAQRRSELNERLAGLRAPAIAAQDAYNRADGLIAEIDTTIRSRQADELLRIGPSPLNPARWWPAVEAMTVSFKEVTEEVTQNLASDERWQALKQTAPALIMMVLLAIALVIFGRRGAERMLAHFRHQTRRGTGVWSFLASLGHVVLPVIGLMLLSSALLSTGYFGDRGSQLLGNLPLYGAVLLGVRWLADQVFGRAEVPGALTMETEQRVSARRASNLLSVLLVLRAAIGDVSDADNYEPVIRAVIDFPLLVLCALVLFWLGRLLLTLQVDETEVAQTRVRIVRILGRGAQIVAIGGVVAGAVGYTNLSEATVYPAIKTLALMGLVLVLIQFSNSLFELITGRSVVDADSLIPVFVGFLLSLASLPAIALLWGARVADLTEFWARFQEGFSLGDTRISPSDFLVFGVVFAIGYALTKLLQNALRNSVLPKTRMDPGGQNAVVSGVGYVGIFVAALVAITSAGIDLSAFAIVAGALSVGIGFGLQNIVSNFVSGIILLIERPISEGDWIEVNGQMGYVRDISVRSTRIETFDRSDVIVPNGDFISGTVTNYTRGNLIGRVIVPVGVAYGTDTRRVEKILSEIARDHPMVMMNPEPTVVFQGFGADSLDFEIRAILTDVNYVLSVKSDMNHEIARRFTEEGIEIPFAQRDVWLRNPEALRGEQASAPAAEASGTKSIEEGDMDTPEEGDT